MAFLPDEPGFWGMLVIKRCKTLSYNYWTHSAPALLTFSLPLTLQRLPASSPERQVCVSLLLVAPRSP